MKAIVFATVFVLAVCAMAMTPQSSKTTATQSPRVMMAQGPQADPATTYEHLATAIIAMHETENSLVYSLLANYAAAARAHLAHAADASGMERKQMLEAAATQITNLANEGDKRVLAVRQRLLKAGHHHNTDEATQEDFMYIDSGEKAALLAFAGSVARMPSATPEMIRATLPQLTSLADDALKSK
jgi:hypothetical protein